MAGRMGEVELVEEGVPDEPPEPATAARRRRRVPRWVWLASAGLAVVLVAAQLGIDAHERAVDARYASTPGFVERLSPSLRVAWHGSPGDPAAWSAGFAGTTGLAFRIGHDGSVTLEARDLRHGHLLWRAPLAGADPERAPLPTGPSPSVGAPARCVLVAPDAHAAPTRVACLTTDDHAYLTDQGVGNGGLMRRRLGTYADVHVLDLATGRPLSTLHTGPAEALDVVGSRLVLAHEEPNGSADVRLVDLGSGAVRWQVSTATSTPDGAVVGATTSASVWRVGDEVVVLDGNDTASRFALADGSVVADPAQVVSLSVDDARERAWLTTVRGGTEGDAYAATLVRAVGHDVTVPGRVVRATADDGTAPGLLLASDAGGRLRGYDATTGRELWRSRAGVASDAVVLHGRVYGRSGAEELSAVDARTGRTLWSTPLPSSVDFGSVMTDGHHVFAVEYELDAGGEPMTTLVATDPGTGKVAWRQRLPGLPEVVGHLFFATGGPAARLTS